MVADTIMAELFPLVLSLGMAAVVTFLRALWRAENARVERRALEADLRAALRPPRPPQPKVRIVPDDAFAFTWTPDPYTGPTPVATIIVIVEAKLRAASTLPSRCPDPDCPCVTLDPLLNPNPLLRCAIVEAKLREACAPRAAAPATGATIVLTPLLLCPHCTAPHEASARFCVGCGATL